MTRTSWIRRLFTRPLRTIRKAPPRVRLTLEVLEDRLAPATFTVNVFTDTSGSAGGSGSGNAGDLRYCVTQADADNSGGSATIVFAQGGQTIALSSSLGTLAVNNTNGETIAIDGPAGGVTIQGGGSSSNFSVFTVQGTATLDGLTITQGHTSGNGGGIANSGTLTLSDSTLSGNSAATYGGGLFNNGTVTLSNSTLSGNKAFQGGGLYNKGTLTLSNSTFSGNSAADGGGLYNNGTLTLSNSTLSGNSASGGGGLFNNGTLTLSNSTLSGNSAFKGGGIFNGGRLTLNNSTLSGNSAGLFGGGIDDGGPVTLSNCTLSGNYAADNGGGIEDGGFLTLSNSIVSGNSAGNQGGGIYSVSTTPWAVSKSIVSGNSAPTNPDIGGNGHSGSLVSGPANLSALGNFGGPTQTFALLPGSSAINAGGALTTVASVDTTAKTITVADGTTIAVTPGTYYVLINGVVHPATYVSSNTFALDNVTGINPAGGDSVYLAYDQRGVARTNTPASNTPDIGAFEGVGYIVTNTSGNIATVGSLPYEVAQAEGDPNHEEVTIGFDPTFFNTPQTITVTATLTLTNTSTGGAIRIEGPPARVSIKGGGSTSNFSVFSVSGGSTATLDNLTIEDGHTSGNGGGVNNSGTLTLSNSTLSGNSAGSEAGGLYNRPGGRVTLSNSTLSGNSARFGGGLYNRLGGSVTLSNSTISGNSASSRCGGLYNYGTLTLSNSTVSGNSAGIGGGILNSGTLTVNNSTLSGNSAASGGGIFNRKGPLTLTNSIVSGNLAGSEAGGIYRLAGSGFGGTVTLSKSIVSGNSAPTNPDIYGPFSGTLVPGPANLSSSLGDYGGPTQTFALLAGSNALTNGGALTTVATITGSTITFASSAAIAVTPGTYSLLIGGVVRTATYVSSNTFTLDNATGVNPTDPVYLAYDQRGVARSATPDIGAFEGVISTTTTISAPAVTYNAVGMVTVTVTANLTVPVAGVSLGVPVGNVTLTVDGTTTLGPFALSAGSYTFDVGVLGAGAHTLSASFAGSTNFPASGPASGSLTVNPAAPIFTGLTGPTITYGTTTATLSGTIKAGSLIPPGNVSITLNGVTQTAAITAGTGAFSSPFSTTALSPNGSPYTITYSYAGSTDFTGVTDTSQQLTVIVVPWTPNYTDLSGYVTQIAATTNANNTLTVFGIGGDGAVWYRQENVGNDPTSFGPWTSFGGYAKGLAVVSPGTGSPPAVFVIGADNAAWVNLEDGSGWRSLGGYVQQLAAATDTNGKLELFAIGGDRAVWADVQSSGSKFSGWNSLGGYVTELAVGQNTAASGGRLQVFGVGGDNALWTNQQQGDGTFSAANWQSLGGYVKQAQQLVVTSRSGNATVQNAITQGAITVAANLDGTLQVFVVGGDNGAWTNKQSAAGAATASGFTGWNSLGGYINDLTVTRNGTLQLFGIGGDNAVWSRTQSTPGAYTGVTFSAYQSFGGYVKQVVSGTNLSNHTAQFFGIGGDNAVYTKAQDILLAPQLLAGTPLVDSGAATLTATDLGPIVAAAEARWEALGISASQFAGLQFDIDSIAPDWLGAYQPGTIYLDPTADGYGWFIDPTPGQDDEFTWAGSQERALPGSAAASHVDLLTVVMHELGHALGLSDIAGGTDLMAEALAAGARRVPSMAHVDAAFRL